MKRKPLKVGFDLDGVLLYNPARIVRYPIEIFKHAFLPKRLNKFYVPKSEPEKVMWRIFHWSSLFIASGFKELKEMGHMGEIEPYIITARFDFLEKDFNKWLEKMHINDSFKGSFLNKKNEQPHIFKEGLVKKLDLDIFVEDNWDIVKHLNKTTRAKTFWVYNIFDRGIEYKHKFPTLRTVIQQISKNEIPRNT